MLGVLLIAATVTVKPPVVLAGCDPNRFIARTYQDLLGRPIDPSSTAYWLGAMKNGVSRTQVATQIMRSTEYRNALAREFYNIYLHRPPSASEAAYFSNMSTEQAESLILASNEYFAKRGGGTSQGFITALYQDVLGRAADPQAIAMFAPQPNRATVAQQVLSSAEARQRWINALYAKYLHHAARMMVSGTYDQVTANILGSDEYCRQ